MAQFLLLQCSVNKTIFRAQRANASPPCQIESRAQNNRSRCDLCVELCLSPSRQAQSELRPMYGAVHVCTSLEMDSCIQRYFFSSYGAYKKHWFTFILAYYVRTRSTINTYLIPGTNSMQQRNICDVLSSCSFRSRYYDCCETLKKT